MSHPGRRQRLIAMIRQSSFPIAPEPANYPARTVVLPDVRWVVFDVYGTLLSSAVGEIGVAARAGDRSGGFNTLSQRYGRDGTTGKMIADLFFNTIDTHHTRLRFDG